MTSKRGPRASVSPFFFQGFPMNQSMIQPKNSTRALSSDELAYCTAVREISQRQFVESLGVLPPHGWHVTDMNESFKLSEMYYGRVTSIFVRVGKYAPRYFTFRDHMQMSHADILARLIDFLASERLPAAQSPVRRCAAVSPDYRWGIPPVTLNATLEQASERALFQAINGSGLSLLQVADLSALQFPERALLEISAISGDYVLLSDSDSPITTACAMTRASIAVPQEHDEQREVVDWLRSNAVMCGSTEATAGQFILTVEQEGCDVPPLVRDALAKAKADGADLLVVRTT